MAVFFGPQHPSNVRALYKTILRLHRGMPCELRKLGDDYVKSEFRRHKEAEPQYVAPFMKEWTTYAVTIAKQLGRRATVNPEYGVGMDTQKFDMLNEHQVGQLYELYQEIHPEVINSPNPTDDARISSDDKRTET